jgi:hypothetical protein
VSDRLGERAAYDAAFADFYDGGLESFGLAGTGADELHEADLWLTCDVPLVDAQTLLARAADDAGANNMLRASLAASRIRVWRIVEDRGGGLIAARCAVTGVDATLDTIRPPWGDVAEGRLLVARSVEVEPGHFALLGRAPVVIGAAQDDFEGFLSLIESEFSDPARLWLAAGGRLDGLSDGGRDVAVEVEAIDRLHAAHR